jgi:thioredoxin 1
MSLVLEVNESNFENEVLQAELPTWVDFWAQWCAPCRTMAPQLEKLAEQYSGKARFVKLDVQANMAIATRYDVSNLPTMLLFVAGEPRERLAGSIAPQRIVDKLGAYL